MSALRIAHPGIPAILIPDPDPDWSLTPRQRQILQVVRSHNGNRSRAARELSITIPAVQASLRLARAAGIQLPPMARRGPDLRQRPSRRREARI